MLLMLLACHRATDKAPVEDTGFVPDLPTASCGVAPHDWRSTQQMGRILASEELTMLSLPAASVDAVLAELEYTDYSPVPYGVKAVAVRYLSQDLGEEREVSALITLPDTGGAAATLPVALFFHPTAGFQDACAGTRDILRSAMPIALASLGFATVTPDYPGIVSVGEPDAPPVPFLAPEPLAITSLDALRALRRYLADAALPLTLDHDQVLWWGQSIGAFTALWADRYVTGYAPRWRPLALVAAVPPMDPHAGALRAVTDFGQGTLTLVATGITQQAWRGSSFEVEDWFRDEAPYYVLSTIEAQVEGECDGLPEIDGLTDASEAFTDAAAAAILAEDWDSLGGFGCALGEADVLASALPPSGPIPVLLQGASDDDIAWPDLIANSVPALCDQGYVVAHHECSGMTHALSTLLDADYSINFMIDRLAGVPMEGACVANAARDCGGL